RREGPRRSHVTAPSNERWLRSTTGRWFAGWRRATEGEAVGSGAVVAAQGRQAEAERGAAPGRALPPDPAAGRVDQPLHDGQAEAHSRHALRCGLRAPERLEDVALLVLGHADALIRHADHGVAAVAPHPHLDQPSVGRVLDGIADQVHEHLLDAEPIAPD